MNSNLKNFIKYHYIATPLELRKQEYWSGLSFPTPGDLPDSGVKHLSLAAPALAGRFFTAAPPGKPELRKQYIKKVSKARTEFFFKSPLFSVNTYSIQLYLMWIMYNSVYIIT